MTNWDAVGAIGEIIGAIAVIATLGYLAVQIRQSRKATIASTSQAITRSQNELNVAAMTDPGLSDVITRGLRDYRQLDRVEKRQFNTYYTSILNVSHCPSTPEPC